MPIAKERHKLKSASGKPVFLIRTKVPKSRKMFGRPFIDGEAHTTNEELAKRFAEEFGYTVILPVGHKGIFLAPDEGSELGKDYKPDTDNFLLDDEEGDGSLRDDE